MTLNAKIGAFVNFLAISGCDTSLYHPQGGDTELSLCDPWRIWYLYIKLAWTPQFLAKLLNRNCYRLSRVWWALAQISCFYGGDILMWHRQQRTELSDAYSSSSQQMFAMQRIVMEIVRTDSLRQTVGGRRCGRLCAEWTNINDASVQSIA